MVFTQLRFDNDEKRSIGAVFHEGKFFGYSLEDPVRAPGVKVPGKTAIAAGTYQLGIRFSPKFGREVIWVMGVPDFEYILVHGGNDVDDTEGCQMWAKNRGKDTIQGSLEKEAFLIVKDAIARMEKCWLKIIDC